jgi:hypothetical protein
LCTATDWISALATVGSAFGTVAAVIVALWLAQKQGRQIRRREERYQAERLTAWFVPYEGPQDHPHRVWQRLRLNNSSDQVIYDVIAQIVALQGAFRDTGVGEGDLRNLEFGALVGNLPPGEVTVRINTGGHGMALRHGIELAFKDAAGRYWLRRGNGSLERAAKHPLQLYGISRSALWQDMGPTPLAPTR